MSIEQLAAVLESCHGQAVNPDISGIGVRLSFYLQNFLLVILVDRSWQDATGALWTFITTSFGLTLSAMIQAKQGQLSLFQALTVGNLVWLANFGTLLALASYSRHKQNAESRGKRVIKGPEQARRRSPSSLLGSKVKLAAMFQTLFSMALTLYVWVNVHTFGNQDDCAPFVSYVAFFAVDFPALDSGRKLGLTATTILICLYFMVTLHELYVHFRLRRLRASCDEERAAEKREPSPFSNLPSPVIVAPTFPVPIPAEKERRPKPRRLFRDVDPMFLGIAIVQIIIFVYFIVSTELLLRHNPAINNSAADWGFGQILALIVVVPSLVSVFSAFQEHGLGRVHRRRGRTISSRKTERRRHTLV